MNDMVSAQQAPMPAQPQAQPQAAPGADATGMENMNPQDIQQFKEGYQLARQFLYQKEIFDGLIQDMRQGAPVNVISGAIVTILLRIQDEVGQLSLAVAAALGIALIDDVMGALEQAGAGQNDPGLQMEIFQAATMLWLQSNQYPAEEVAQSLSEIGAPPEMIQAVMASQQEQGPDPMGQQPDPGMAAPQQAMPPEQGGMMQGQARDDGMGKQARGLLQRGAL
ncbi:MAG: hypothetical protein M0Q95_17185 [Porticoccaceae bacterium]|nr:hypothetical protein [Porticoccaceae bacterium]